MDCPLFPDINHLMIMCVYFENIIEDLSPSSTGNWVFCWLPNANEMNTKNMKYTWPTQQFCVGDPTRPILH